MKLKISAHKYENSLLKYKLFMNKKQSTAVDDI